LFKERLEHLVGLGDIAKCLGTLGLQGVAVNAQKIRMGLPRSASVRGLNTLWLEIEEKISGKVDLRTEQNPAGVKKLGFRQGLDQSVSSMKHSNDKAAYVMKA
jgi:hypothetical protein